MILTCPHCGARLCNECLKEVQDTAVIKCRWCKEPVRIIRKVTYEVVTESETILEAAESAGASKQYLDLLRETLTNV